MLTARVDNGQSLRIYTDSCGDDATCITGFAPTRYFIGVADVEYCFLVSKQVFTPGSDFTFEVEKFVQSGCQAPSTNDPELEIIEDATEDNPLDACQGGCEGLDFGNDLCAVRDSFVK